MTNSHIFSKTIPILGLAIACNAAPPDDAGPQDLPVLRPTQMQVLSLEYTSIENGSALSTSGRLAVGRSGPLAIVGGDSGLYEITSSGLKLIDAQPVSAITDFGTSGLVVANADGLFLFSGSLHRSPISDALGTAKITALATRDTQLWIGTDLGLYVYENEMLHSFDETMNVLSVQTFSGNSDVVIKTVAGFEVYRLIDNAWTRLSLDQEITISELAPSTNGRLLGLSAGSLLQRVELEEDKAVWRALSTTTVENDPGARGVDAIVSNPSTGAVWIIEAATLSRIDPNEGSVSNLARPNTISSVQSAAVSSDGSLWIYDGAKLHELGQSGELITYSTISAMSEASCNGCHKSTLGTAPMSLETYMDWTGIIDKIIQRLDEQTMPPSGTDLVGGTADTVRQWKALGMPQ
jgi:hypothetical protein